MDRIDLEIGTIMRNAMDLVRIGETAAGPVAQNSAVLPTCLPKFVDRDHVIFGDGVAFVVAGLLGASHAARRAFKIAGDDVPTHAPAGEVVQRAHAASERV